MDEKLNKKEVEKLYEQLGNEPSVSNTNDNLLDWLRKNNPDQQIVSQETGKKKPCKSCGNNKKTIIVLIVIGFTLMLAGHGLFTLLGNIF